MPTSSSVIVCTYNAPFWLDLALTGLERQHHSPDEILVADDGSGDETAALVARRAAASRIPIRHLWHRDDGVRRAAIVNAAMAVASGDHVAFLDGDCVPHRRWLSDHLARADGGSALCGRRMRLGPDWSRRLTSEVLAGGSTDAPWRPFLVSGFLRRQVSRYHLAFRLPRSVVGLLVGNFKSLMGCNFSAPRTILEEVNGYDASWPGAGYLCDDFDLEVRLCLAGVTLRPLLHAGNVFHMYHDERPRAAVEMTLRGERLLLTEPRALDGIDTARARLAAGEVVDRLASC